MVVRAVGMELEKTLTHLKMEPLLSWTGGDGAKVESANLDGLKLRQGYGIVLLLITNALKLISLSLGAQDHNFYGDNIVKVFKKAVS